MVNPHVIAAMVAHDRDRSPRSFGEDLFLHLEHGYVISGPEFFVMGRAVRRDATYGAITSPWIDHKDPDCWWVYLASGDVRKFSRAMPYPLPWIGFERDNVPAFYATERILRRVPILQPSGPSPAL